LKVFNFEGLSLGENRVPREIFGLEVYEITSEWRKLRNKELNDLYCSPHIIGVMKSRKMR
jgi:hypothetical protein